jgi:adenylate cyclase
LPPIIDAVADNGENEPPLRFLDSVDFSIGQIGDRMLDGLETGVLVFDPEGALVRANPAARRILRGWNLTPTSSMMDGLCEGPHPLFVPDIRDAVAGTEASVATDAGIATTDGERMPVRRVIRPIMVSGKRCGAMVLLDDIGHKRRLQSMLDTTLSSGEGGAINSSAAAPGAAMREVTVLAANIRGFTALAKSLGAGRVIDLLNEYYTYMADVVGAEDGVIDKLVGDAIIVLFGVPISHGDAADRAVAAAQRMHRALKLMNEMRGIPALQVGVGLGSGPAIAGLIGLPDRMSYTVIGEPASLASRIERVSKAYGARILICGETFSRLTCPVAARRLDVVLLPGRDTPIELYEVFAEDPGNAATGWLAAFDAGVSAYLEGDFIVAQTHLADARELNPDDVMATMLAQRCRRLALGHGGLWTGAWKLSDGQGGK